MQRLTISKTGDQICVEDKSRSGSASAGYGRNIYEAVGAFFHANQHYYGLYFEVDESAAAEEQQRRRAELDVT